MGDLSELKVGDEVALVKRNTWSASQAQIVAGRVEKVTKTQITAFNGRRFKISNGEEVGFSKSRFPIPDRLQPMTNDLREEAEKWKSIVAARNALNSVASFLSSASGEDAIRLRKMLPEKLVKEAREGK